MNASDMPGAIPFIGDGEEPAFPTPWAARAFAMTLALHKAGRFTWPEWSAKLAEFVGRDQKDCSDPEAYWIAWLDALNAMVLETDLAEESELDQLVDAWRQVAEQTPHGEPLDLQQTVIDAIANRTQ